MRIITNFSSFPARWNASSGESGEAVEVQSVPDFLRYSRDREALFLVNCSSRMVLSLAAAFLAVPFLRKPLISVDLVLRKPAAAIDRATLRLKRRLLACVDHHIYYFKDLRGYQQVFGIGPERSSFVPFKVNFLPGHPIEPQPEGDYVLCLGRSMRDFDTFFAAMELLPYPGAIADPQPDQLRTHGARFTRNLASLPKNIRILQDEGGDTAQIRMLNGARLVVLPILKASMVASGISTCLNAMYLRRCVIGSEGPGMSDIFGGEVLTVPAENPQALADVIRRAWEDDKLRATTAAAGWNYALRAGGEPELYQRIIDQVAGWFTRSRL
jgi:glycosyltransferase involved in cell wall biosynthesis